MKCIKCISNSIEGLTIDATSELRNKTIDEIIA